MNNKTHDSHSQLTTTIAKHVRETELIKLTQQQGLSTLRQPYNTILQEFNKTYFELDPRPLLGY